jgi:hypothetical protein
MMAADYACLHIDPRILCSVLLVMDYQIDTLEKFLAPADSSEVLSVLPKLLATCEPRRVFRHNGCGCPGFVTDLASSKLANRPGEECPFDPDMNS